MRNVDARGELTSNCSLNPPTNQLGNSKDLDFPRFSNILNFVFQFRPSKICLKVEIVKGQR